MSTITVNLEMRLFLLKREPFAYPFKKCREFVFTILLKVISREGSLSVFGTHQGFVVLSAIYCRRYLILPSVRKLEAFIYWIEL